MANSESTKKSWFDGLKAEFKKIIWPTREDVTKETAAVAVSAVLVGVLIAMLDFIIQNGIDFLVKIG